MFKLKPYHTEALVLRAIPVQEADRVLVLLTPERGKLRAWAHGAARPSSRKRGAVQLFCRASFLMEEGRELDSVRQAEALEDFSDLQADLVLLGSASYFCELVEGFVAEEAPSPGVYQLLLQSLRALRSYPPSLVMFFFQSRLWTLIGLKPVTDHCVLCGACFSGAGYSSAWSGGLLCPECSLRDREAVFCSPAAIQVWRKMFSWPLARLNRLQVSSQVCAELTAAMTNYTCYYLEYKPKSLVFLEKMK